jgi:hypothetical protein
MEVEMGIAVNLGRMRELPTERTGCIGIIHPCHDRTSHGAHVSRAEVWQISSISARLTRAPRLAWSWHPKEIAICHNRLPTPDFFGRTLDFPANPGNLAVRFSIPEHGAIPWLSRSCKRRGVFDQAKANHCREPSRREGFQKLVKKRPLLLCQS